MVSRTIVFCVLLFAAWISVTLCLRSLASAPEAEKSTVRVAAISFEPKKFDLQGNADRLEAAFRKACRGGAKIAVAPEGALEGYVVNQIIAGEAPAQRMNEVAVEIDHPVIERFRKLARELEMCLVFGFAEKIGGDVYNCAVFIDGEGTIRGKHHKMQFAEGYHDSWWYNRLGNQCRAFNTPYGRCGILICNDRWNAKLARIAALDGAQYFIIPSYGSTKAKQDQAVLSRGTENSVPVIQANVGVTLVVDHDRIAAVDRRREGITFADITIPPATPAQPKLRDQVEQEFLHWREKEMPKRFEKKKEHLRQLQSIK